MLIVGGGKLEQLATRQGKQQDGSQQRQANRRADDNVAQLRCTAIADAVQTIFRVKDFALLGADSVHQFIPGSIILRRKRARVGTQQQVIGVPNPAEIKIADFAYSLRLVRIVRRELFQQHQLLGNLGLGCDIGIKKEPVARQKIAAKTRFHVNHGSNQLAGVGNNLVGVVHPTNGSVEQQNRSEERRVGKEC